MFASATSGERPNNSKFSNCSVGNISAVLDAIEDGRKKNCFSGTSTARPKFSASVNRMFLFFVFMWPQ